MGQKSVGDQTGLASDVAAVSNRGDQEAEEAQRRHGARDGARLAGIAGLGFAFRPDRLQHEAQHGPGEGAAEMAAVVDAAMGR